MPGKRSMLAFSPERAAQLAETLAAHGLETERKKMFGHEVHFLNGYMFAGANVAGVFVHVGEEAARKALAGESGVAAFQPMAGMTMKDYLLLQPPLLSDARRFRGWLTAAAAYLKARPAKSAKKKTAGR